MDLTDGTYDKRFLLKYFMTKTKILNSQKGLAKFRKTFGDSVYRMFDYRSYGSSTLRRAHRVSFRII